MWLSTKEKIANLVHQDSTVLEPRRAIVDVCTQKRLVLTCCSCERRSSLISLSHYGKPSFTLFFERRNWRVFGGPEKNSRRIGRSRAPREYTTTLFLHVCKAWIACAPRRKSQSLRTRGSLPQLLHSIGFSDWATQRQSSKNIPVRFISLIPRKFLFGKNQGRSGQLLYWETNTWRNRNCQLATFFRGALGNINPTLMSPDPMPLPLYLSESNAQSNYSKLPLHRK